MTLHKFLELYQLFVGIIEKVWFVTIFLLSLPQYYVLTDD